MGGDAFDSIAHLVESKFGKSKIQIERSAFFSKLKIDERDLLNVLRFLFSDPSCKFDFLESIVATDEGKQVSLIYQLFSMPLNHRVNVYISLKNGSSSGQMEIETISTIWSSARPFEREIRELFGIEFNGLNDDKEFLLPKDWVGFPMRASMPAKENQ